MQESPMDKEKMEIFLRKSEENFNPSMRKFFPGVRRIGYNEENIFL